MVLRNILSLIYVPEKYFTNIFTTLRRIKVSMRNEIYTKDMSSNLKYKKQEKYSI